MSFTASELFKHAIMSGDMRNTSATDSLDAMAEESAQSLMMDPEKNPAHVVAERAVRAGLNKDQINRLVEKTNHKLLKPVLQSKSKASRRPIVNKNDVVQFVSNRDTSKETPTGFTTRGRQDLPKQQLQGDKAKGVTKTASVPEDFALRMNRPDMSDYMEDPVSFGMQPLDKWEPEEEPVSMAKISKERGYKAAAISHHDDQIAALEIEIESQAGSFAKLASDYVIQGTPFLDVIQGSIQIKPDKSTVEMLKMAAKKCYERGLMLEKEALEWIDALDIVKTAGNPAMDKTARLGLPVSDSLINEDISGRVRIINGDSQIIKLLNRVGDTEKRLRASRLVRQSLSNEPEANYSRKVVNISD